MRALELDDLVVVTLTLHNAILSEHEVQGLASDKSLESILARPYHRLVYDLVEDVYHYAACCCVAVIQGHPFNDGNKRTGLALMALILELNGISIAFPQLELADQMVDVATGKRDDYLLAKWIRRFASTH